MMSKPKFSTFSSLNVDKKGHISSKIQWSAFFIKLMCAIEFQNERKDEKYSFFQCDSDFGKQYVNGIHMQIPLW